MRTLLLCRLAAALLLVTIPLLAAGFAGMTQIAVADDDDNNGNAQDDGDDDGDGDDGNRGHGNDDDGFDEDNPGQGGDNSGPGNQQDGDRVLPLDGYTIDASCEPNEAEGSTACEFTGSAPPDGKKLGEFQLPAEAACATVLETNADRTDTNPHTGLTGYTAKGDDVLRLVFEGQVTVAGTTTWWIKAANNVFPATGPALACAPAVQADFAASSQPAPATPTATSVPTTGTLLVTLYTCTDVPADRTGFDWFGACAPAGAGATFGVGPAGAADAPLTTATTDDGTARFDGLEPGTYELDLVDGSWCHAKSDRVTADSDLVVEAGLETNAWIFLCEPTSGA